MDHVAQQQEGTGDGDQHRHQRYLDVAANGICKPVAKIGHGGLLAAVRAPPQFQHLRPQTGFMVIHYAQGRLVEYPVDIDDARESE